MIPTVEILTEKFKEYNKLYFDGKLPMPRLEIMHTYKISGHFIFTPVKKGRIKYKKIYITDNFDFTEETFRDILVHEMIHYYIAYNKIEDNDDHGVEFMKIADELNKKYGLGITKQIDASSFKRNEKASKLSWFFIKLFGC